MLTARRSAAQRSPDAPCLQRIGDQLHADRFVWGNVVKAPGNQITAEVHLWARGRPDTFARETYSDNLRDQNDETLRRIATRILERISGAATSGTVTVHAGDVEGGVVWIDGQRKQPLAHGAATIDLPAGSYQVEVRAKGFANATQSNVVVAGGQDTSVVLKLAPESAAETSAAGTGSSGDGPRVQRIVGFSLVGLGVAAEIVAGIEGIRFLSAKSDLNNDRSQVPATVTDVCATNVAFNAAAANACAKYGDAKDAATIGFVAGGVGLVAIIGG